jgi:hypothetical protein
MPSADCEVYGLHLIGVGGGGLPSASGNRQPGVTVRHARQGPEPGYVSTERASLDLPGRQLLLQRAAGTATFTGPPLSHDELVHPYLGAAASVFSRWAGREVYHAGAFVCDGLAWAVVGGRGAGKSSLLAALAARRVPVLADDLVITDGQQVFCGPRTIDLRRPPVAAAGPVTRARGASRWRLALPPLPGAMPLGGWIYLSWRNEVAINAVPASVSLVRLAARRTWPALPSDPEKLLALSACPGWDLGRPADWARMDEAVTLILQTLQGRRVHGSPISISPAVAHPSRKRETSWVAAADVSPKELTSTRVSSLAVAPPAIRSHSNAAETLSAW